MIEFNAQTYRARLNYEESRKVEKDANRHCFNLKPQSCPDVEEGIQNAQETIETALDTLKRAMRRALEDAEQHIKDNATYPFRDALTEATLDLATAKHYIQNGPMVSGKPLDHPGQMELPFINPDAPPMPDCCHTCKRAWMQQYAPWMLRNAA